jgi:hypothetical protein
MAEFISKYDLQKIFSDNDNANSLINSMACYYWNEMNMDSVNYLIGTYLIQENKAAAKDGDLYFEKFKDFQQEFNDSVESSKKKLDKFVNRLSAFEKKWNNSSLNIKEQPFFIDFEQSIVRNGKKLHSETSAVLHKYLNNKGDDNTNKSTINPNALYKRKVVRLYKLLNSGSCRVDKFKCEFRNLNSRMVHFFGEEEKLKYILLPNKITKSCSSVYVYSGNKSTFDHFSQMDLWLKNENNDWELSSQ